MGKKSRLKKEYRKAVAAGLIKNDMNTTLSVTSNKLSMYTAALNGVSASSIQISTPLVTSAHVVNGPVLHVVLNFEFHYSGLWFHSGTTVDGGRRYSMGIDFELLTEVQEQLLDTVAMSPACIMCRYSLICLQGERIPTVCAHCRLILSGEPLYVMACSDNHKSFPVEERHPHYRQESLKVGSRCPIFQASATFCDCCDKKWGNHTKARALAHQAKEDKYAFMYGGQTLRALEQHEAGHKRQYKSWRRAYRKVLWKSIRYTAAKPFKPMVDFLRKKYGRRKNDVSFHQSRKKK